MFSPNSRYKGAGQYQVKLPSGVVVTATRLPSPRKISLLGYYRRHEGQRLDLIANYYLNDPTAFWRLCDASGAVAPDALAARELIAVPAKKG